MIKAIVSDFSRILLFPKDKNYQDSLNVLHKQLSQGPDYNVLDYFNLNIELLSFYKSLKDKINLCILTSDVIQDSPEFQPHLLSIFSKVFSASKMNMNKKDPAIYEKIVEELNLKPEEILYIDDSAGNIQVAQQAGIRVFLYENNTDIIAKIRKAVDAEA